MKQEKRMKFITAIVLSAAISGCAQFPFCPEIKLAMCPSAQVAK